MRVTSALEREMVGKLRVTKGVRYVRWDDLERKAALIEAMHLCRYAETTGR